MAPFRRQPVGCSNSSAARGARGGGRQRLQVVGVGKRIGRLLHRQTQPIARRGLGQGAEGRVRGERFGQPLQVNRAVWKRGLQLGRHGGAPNRERGADQGEDAPAPLLVNQQGVTERHRPQRPLPPGHQQGLEFGGLPRVEARPEPSGAHLLGKLLGAPVAKDRFNQRPVIDNNVDGGATWSVGRHSTDHLT